MDPASRNHEVVSAHGVIPVVSDEPARPSGTVVLAHGAGGGMHSEFMGSIATGIAHAGWKVVRFEFPYMTAGRRAPDRPQVLEEALVAVLDRFREDPGPLVAGGKSMGGRIASQVAAAGTPVGGLVFLGYPLHPPGKPEKMRDAHLYEIKAPMLFVEGTRDPFCPLETLAGVRRRLPRSELAVIEDGDHSFKVRKSSGRSIPEAWREVADAVTGWLALL